VCERRDDVVQATQGRDVGGGGVSGAMGRGMGGQDDVAAWARCWGGRAAEAWWRGSDDSGIVGVSEE
jgi:hypothetical protein